MVYKGRGKYVYFVRPKRFADPAQREREDRGVQHHGGAQDGRGDGRAEEDPAALIAEQRGEPGAKTGPPPPLRVSLPAAR